MELKKRLYAEILKQLTLESAAIAETFYQKYGVISQGSGNYYSALVAAYLSSNNMAISL
ncbi:hypothetical protein [Providencia stuartii]|uniref:hypothetical protein n=1 Tax=Providencia stuartii TaxID=588 RepID=UPI0024B1155C